MSRYIVAWVFLLLLVLTSAAPLPRLATIVSGVTTGLEVPRDLITGIGAGTGSLQLVVNVLTDSQGNIEVFTN